MRKRSGRGVFFLVLYLWLNFCTTVQADAPDIDGSQPLRIAFSSSMFTEVNVDDARAAMKVWMLTVAKEWDIPVDPDPYISPTIEGLMMLGLEKSVAGFALTTPEYTRLSQQIKIDRVAVSLKNGQTTVNYILLIRKEIRVDSLAQLQGKNLYVLNNPRMSLAVIWLDTALLNSGLNRTSGFFSQIIRNKNASQVILPVFFGKADACLATRESFEVMGELNPQLKTQLHVLATSPEYIPSCFAFRADYTSAHRPRLLEAMGRFSDSPAGRQILALTHSDRVVSLPVSCLDQSLELIKKHTQLVKKD